MLGRRWAAFASVSLALSLGGCGAAPPPKPRPKTVVDETPEPQSSEWLYATKGLSRSDLLGECDHVRQVVAGESKCTGEACEHASRLSRDWLNRCRKAMPGALGEVSELARVYAERRAGARVPCLREIEPILKEGCGKTPDCRELAQSWTTRCGELSGSPLIVRILEARLEQSERRARVKLDQRGCSQLASELRAAASCSQKFQCDDGLAVVDRYRDRCVAAGAVPGLAEGLAELTVRLGAQQSPKPLAIQPALVELEPASFPLPLAEGHGVVTLVCGERPNDLTSYLAARQSCQNGEVVVIRRNAGRSKDAATLQIGRFPHLNDQAFGSRYPGLKVRNETAARRAVDLEHLAKDLATVANGVASTNLHDASSSAALIKALAKVRSTLRIPTTEPALAEVDAALSPHFERLARAKLQAAKKLYQPLEHAGFVRRSLKRPLADLDDTGEVLPGMSNAAASVDLATVLPKASAAYGAELKSFADRVRRQALTEKQKNTLENARAEALAACSAAQNKVRESEVDLRECGFGAGCDDELMTELGRDLEASHREGALSRIRFVLATDSLDPSPEPSAGEARCVEPWW